MKQRNRYTKQKMVQGPGIEPGSTDFQSVAEMTTLAHPELKIQLGFSASKAETSKLGTATG